MILLWCYLCAWWAFNLLNVIFLWWPTESITELNGWPEVWIRFIVTKVYVCLNDSRFDYHMVNFMVITYYKFTTPVFETIMRIDFSVIAWWRHQMETFSAVLALSARNSPVTGELPAQRPVTRSFDVFFHLCLNKRLSKQSRGWWFETPSCSLWRHCNGMSR